MVKSCVILAVGSMPGYDEDMNKSMLALPPLLLADPVLADSVKIDGPAKGWKGGGTADQRLSLIDIRPWVTGFIIVLLYNKPLMKLPKLSLPIVLAFFSIYVVWGSTYLAIRFAIQTLPTWGMAASRFLVAGVIMLGISMLARERRLSRAEMKTALTSGVLLMGANALVCFVERWIPSGIVALVIGAMPIWVLLIGRIGFGQPTPSARKWVGSLIGLSGVALIALDQTSLDFEGVGRYAIVVLLLSNWMWGIGTHVQRAQKGIESPFRFSAWQMLLGGFTFGLVSVALGEPFRFDPSAVSTASFFAWAYLVVFGSVIAFTAYSWLASRVEPHLLSTYALVNPVIAVALGVALGNESMSPRFFAAMALVCVGLYQLLFGGRARAGAPAAAPPSADELLRVKALEECVGKKVVV